MEASLRRPLVAVAVALLCCRCGVLSFPDPREREALIELETSMQVGGQVVLTDAEKRLDAVLLKMKQRELMKEEFPPAMHFFKARPLIEASPIFTLLQKMPKGAFSSVQSSPTHDITLQSILFKCKVSSSVPGCK